MTRLFTILCFSWQNVKVGEEFRTQQSMDCFFFIAVATALFILCINVCTFLLWTEMKITCLRLASVALF